MPARALPEKFLVAFSLAGEQRDLVRAIAEVVEGQLGRGAVFLDEWFEPYLAGNDADLKLQDIYGQRCELAVVCVSQRYGCKPWTQAEHRAIRARFMHSDKRQRDTILPIRVGDGDVEGILFNAIVPDIRNRSVQEGAQLIIDRLRFVKPELETEASPASAVAGVVRPIGSTWSTTPPPLSWPMANHNGVREAFGELLTSGVSWRVLRIRGESDTGKSHVTKQMLANVLAIPKIACGRFDFKGTTNLDREVRVFVQELGVQAPPAGGRLQERLEQIVAALRQRARPTLLIFDTYEMAGEAQEWVAKSLLQSLIRSAWLRVVIAGQQVPDSSGSVWSAVACPTLALARPLPADWFKYGKQHRADLTLADVETICRYASDKVAVLAQLFGPGS